MLTRAECNPHDIQNLYYLQSIIIENKMSLNTQKNELVFEIYYQSHQRLIT